MKFKNQRLINQLSDIKKNMKELENIDKAENLIQIDEEQISKKKLNQAAHIIVNICVLILCL